MLIMSQSYYVRLVGFDWLVFGMAVAGVILAAIAVNPKAWNLPLFGSPLRRTLLAGCGLLLCAIMNWLFLWTPRD
jgi:hypothetical protein